MQQQLADKARQIAMQATGDRQAKERNAIVAAGNTRQAERQLQSLRQTLVNSEQAAVNSAGQTLQLTGPSKAARNRHQTHAIRGTTEHAG